MTYDAKQGEEKWRKFWEKEKIYKFNPMSGKKIFSIDTPPPTVSGKMHIGHAFSYAQQDFIVRFRRMLLGNVFYPFGTDDNGLPTERLVEKMNDVKSTGMQREEFIQLCLKTLKKILPGFILDWKILGISVDYDIYYSTIDEHSRKISQGSFLDLYKTRRIYKAEVPTIFCTNCQTSIAQAELDDKEEKTLFSTVLFSLENGKKIRIATTRPELLPACVAIFVNPSDKRYKKLIGKKAEVPLFKQKVKILADKSADIEKGTGILMICSYGDKYDVDAVKKHKLKPRIALNKDGRLNELAGKYKGMYVKEARGAILEDLKNACLLSEQKQISHFVNVHDKCGYEIEFLPVSQWFIKILDKKEQLIRQGRKIKWYPAFMRTRYENWIKGLEWDWAISRQRHFGVPIPVWYCKKCKNISVAEKNQLPIDPMKDKPKRKCRCGSKDFEGERQVLDTWMTSSMTPKIAAELVRNVKIPENLRPQAHDIIRTWAFYTIVKALFHYNKIPWKDVMVSGFVLDPNRQKMAKSKGNVIAPQEIFEKYPVDALRYWAASSKLGEDLSLQEKELVAGVKFINKIFNASKFVFINMKSKPKKPAKLELMDKWMLVELSKVIDFATKNFLEYNYSKASADIQNFFWRSFCDNYLEIVKNRVYAGDNSAKYTLYHCLLTILKMMAPVTPFITEEIYQKHFRKYEKDKSIHISKWPDLKMVDKKSEKIGDLFIQVLEKVRKMKADEKKSIKAEIILALEKEKINKLNPALEDLKAVCNAKEIKKGEFNVEFA